MFLGTLATTMAINGFCLSLSDILCQNLEIHHAKRNKDKMLRTLRAKKGASDSTLKESDIKTEEKKYSPSRTMRFGGVGFMWKGPTTFMRYWILQTLFPHHAVYDALLRTLCNQFLFSPVITAGLLFGNELGRSGGDWSGSVKKVKSNLLEVQSAVWVTKVPLNFFCFFMIPTIPMQALFMRSYDICFYVWVDYVAHRKEKVVADGEEKEEESPEEGTKSEP
eukprot:NODE_1124_length_1273_cov_42.648693_g920_i0.p1 GENE.NODE_1124_length_1273_cov_42.648693_g920_i0~~NODE_1124_length_1273_cov_42.648693_g920_i0.p1  ORF type:complete len:222 (-),score=63.06 NODE_1124_length_1273_cov_42.648693_g920_i0:69-734(-)